MRYSISIPSSIAPPPVFESMSLMEESPSHPPPPALEEQDDWDTDGFVIPSLAIGEPNQSISDISNITDAKRIEKIEENIYLGPHGAPPSQARQQDLRQSRKQQFKSKLREADKKTAASTGWENKVDNIRELVGSKANSLSSMSKSSRDWLDPHCHESQFEKCTRRLE